MLKRKREAIAEERKHKTVATQTSGSGRIEGDSGEVELDEGLIDDLLMEIKAGSLQCRRFL